MKFKRTIQGGEQVRNILEAQDLNKTYRIGKENHLNVLVDVNMQIAESEFVAVMGPSGSGKSTLLNNISGMDRPTSGRITFKGKNVGELSESETAELRLRDMGFIFQNMYLLSNLNIYDNVVLPGYTLKKEKRKVINGRASLLMQQTGIAGLEDNDITQVSGGQLQRVAICRALINKPSITLGDEPTCCLNSRFAEEVMDVLGGINRKGTPTLLAAHDINVAARTERILYMNDGNIVGGLYLGKLNPDKENLHKRRSEERRVGKECRSRGGRCDYK